MTEPKKIEIEARKLGRASSDDITLPPEIIDKIVRYSDREDLVVYMEKILSKKSKRRLLRHINVLNVLKSRQYCGTYKVKFIKTLIDLGLDIDWVAISKLNLPQCFITEFINNIVWINYIENNNISLKVIEKQFPKVLYKFDGVIWSVICRSQVLKEDEIEKYLSKLRWSNICKSQELSESFILKHKSRIRNWSKIGLHQKLSEFFIMLYGDLIGWDIIIQNQTLTGYFIYKNIFRFKWADICRYQVLSESFMRVHADKLHWQNVLVYQNVSTSFLEDHISYLNAVNREFVLEIEGELGPITGTINHWPLVSQFQQLSEAFMRKYYKFIDWRRVSAYQTLSVEFMRDFSDRISWLEVTKNQDMTYEFMLEYFYEIEWCEIKYNDIIDPNMVLRFASAICPECLSGGILLSEKSIENNMEKIDWEILCRSQFLTEKVIEKFHYLINWDLISSHQVLSEEFIIRHIAVLNWKIIVKYQKLTKRIYQAYEKLTGKLYFVEDLYID